MNAGSFDDEAGRGPDPAAAAIEHFAEAVVRQASRDAPGDLRAILPNAYVELRVLAAYLLRGESAARTLQPTALAHEAYLRLVRETRSELQGREHLLALAATVMRRVLVDHARSRGAVKRGRHAAHVTLSDQIADPSGFPVDVLDLHRGLERLAAEHPRKVRVVELIFFAGLTQEEAGAVLGVTAQTVLRDWRFAKAWLWQELGGRIAGGAG